MIRAVRPLPLLLATLTLSACGYAEWPPKSQIRTEVEQGRDPGAASGAQAFTGATAVVVGKGDTVYGLSRRHGVSMRAIILANKLEAPFHLSVGQRIVLPRNPEHLVKKGDTLSQIAAGRGMSMYELARLNGLKPPYTIFVGQRLRLPGSAGASATSVVAADGDVKTVSVSPRAGQSAARKPAPPPLPSKPPAWATAKKPAPRSVASAPVATPVAAAPRAVPKPASRSGKGFQWPVRGRVISSFGAKAKGLRNDGINIAAARGTPVKAAENGVVVYAGNELRGFGNLVLIKHAGGWVSAYAHNERLDVKRGDKVKKGQRIAAVGASGGVTTPQLHFELRKGRQARDPKKYLRNV